MTDDHLRPKLGVSACLVGQPVRYNGSSAKDDRIRYELGEVVDLVPLCPELAMGLGTPRPAMRLVRREGGPRLVTARDEVDLTETAQRTVRALVSALPEDLDGYVLMRGSPTCGQERVKVYDDNGIPFNDGVGLFARELLARRPTLVIVEAGRLSDTPQREHFLLRLFTQARFRHLERSVAALHDFHARHKFLLLALGRRHLTALGQIAAEATRHHLAAAFAAYGDRLFQALAQPPRRGSLADALEHMYGYVRGELADNERHRILAAITDFRQGAGSLPALTALIQFANLRKGSRYLENQILLQPWPITAGLPASLGAR